MSTKIDAPADDITLPTLPPSLDREALVDLIAEHLSGTYHCGRVWEAWSVGTMSEDDFSDVGESDTPGEIADAILALAAPRQPAAVDVGAAQAETAQAAQAWCSYCGGAGDVHSLDGEWRGECTGCPVAITRTFKNFHANLCKRFGYAHDEKDWQRDLVSLEEHVAKLAAQAAPVVPADFWDRPGPQVAAPMSGREPTLREAISGYYRFHGVEAKKANKMAADYIAATPGATHANN